MDPVQTMPDLSVMTTKGFTIREWLSYYKNVWNRNLAARLIDVQCDTVSKAINPEEPMQLEDGREIPVKQRLEMRKILVQDAVDLIAGIDALLALSDEKLLVRQTKEALAVAEDMKPIVPKVGDVCAIDGKAGTLQDDGNGGLKCVANPEPAPEAGVDTAQADDKKAEDADEEAKV